MFVSEKEYINRYNDTYTWKKLDDPTHHFGPIGKEVAYVFEMSGDSLKYCRIGGKEGQDELDCNDLGMFDPSGGPFVTIGTAIDEKKITRIQSYKQSFMVICE